MYSTLVLSLALLASGADAGDADYLIRGATVYDGTGKPGAPGDVAIKGERILAVGTGLKAGPQTRVLDGTGLVVAPGFIDLHTHSDNAITQAGTRNNLNYLMQGVTTIVTGNCGSGPVDTADYYKKLEANKPGSNVAHQVPHNNLRRQVMGNANRVPTAEELDKMKALTDKAMKDGAWGLSTGLYYTPGSYAQTDELVELSKVAAAHGGFYASHMRDEGPGLLASVTETLTIGKRAGLPVHISHFKAYSRRAWGTAPDAIALVEKARAEGQAVTADQYPYTASSTSLQADLIPTLYREGTPKDFQDRLADPVQGPKVRKAIEDNIANCDNGRAIRIANHARHPEWAGKDLATLAQQEKKSVLELVLDIEKNGGAQIVNFSMKDEEVRLIMRLPYVATASDGGAMLPAGTMPHPRSYGTFPRKVGRFAIAEQVLPLERALRSASGLPADILRLPERGYLKAGYYADVVAFDPKAFRDAATFEKPHQYAQGMRHVFVNGTPAVRDGKSTGELAGVPLRHQAKGR